MSGNVETNVRPNPDDVLVKIADYVLDKNIDRTFLNEKTIFIGYGF